MKTIKVLSLFDGISVAQQAIKEMGYEVVYYASEINKYAIQITQKNHQNTIQLGDVRNIRGDIKVEKPQYIFSNENGELLSHYTGGIDLLIGGSPCQDLSVAKGSREGLKGRRSALFYEYLRILKEIKPKYFILENVASMRDADRDIISEEIGIQPIMIDAGLVSAQERKRYYWTNIKGIQQPKDRGLVINDILELEETQNRKYLTPQNTVRTKRGIKWDKSGKGYYSQQDRAYSVNGKHPTLPTARTITKVNVLFDDGVIGVLTWNEIERLQSLQDGYTDLGNRNRIEKRGGVIGNAFNKEVIKHILSHIL